MPFSRHALRKLARGLSPKRCRSMNMPAQGFLGRAFHFGCRHPSPKDTRSAFCVLTHFLLHTIRPASSLAAIVMEEMTSRFPPQLMPANAPSRPDRPQGGAMQDRPFRMRGRSHARSSQHWPSIRIGGHVPPFPARFFQIQNQQSSIGILQSRPSSLRPSMLGVRCSSSIRWIVSKSGVVLRHRHCPPHEC